MSETISSGGNEAQEIIRISPENSPAGSAHMTQQGKIAAAMKKAGVTNTAGWGATQVQDGSKQTGMTEEPDQNAAAVLLNESDELTLLVSPQNGSDEQKRAALPAKLLMWSGLALATLCLCLLAARFL